MVKSFQGVRIAESDTRASQPILVEDHMTTHLITFHPNDTIDYVIQLLTQKKISGAPVLDDQQNLVGIISEVDCLKEIIRGKYNNTPRMAGRVSEHMTKEVITMEPEVTIFDAAHQFLELKIRRFPVVKNGKLLGQISLSDIIRAMPRLKSATW
ncbi:inosine-5-monophosphate dehydrogenase [Echinicola strongylocentroti]|uniref:Inosine-5-monophosphate dehydrogenase n=1 Tax=Echinicola strongylocentroti TaxID=1795355 RepID=A0A2Z4IEL1_9BACT|nr:CBS domain-containing protein [Echinicola strongylocentroti]AWW29364.1 inosine-5-monophosphate dehydrogenase [Echinicola strongylocentroti]